MLCSRKSSFQKNYQEIRESDRIDIFQSIPPMVIFSFALVSYIIFTGGVVYCTITGMPFVGEQHSGLR